MSKEANIQWAFDVEARRRMPKNLRVESDPYPHLRDDEGCVLARDYIHDGKMAFVLEAVREKLERDTPA